MTYLCVIFDPLKEVRREEYIGGMGLSNMKPPIYPLSIQFPEGGKLLSATTQVRKGGVAEDLYAIQKFENIFLRPSANLDVDATKWGFCVADVMVKMRLESGALEVVHPEKSALEKDERGIGYHM